jgi:hypothetical protein
MSSYGEYITIDEYGYIDYNDEDESKWGWLAARVDADPNAELRTPQLRTPPPSHFYRKPENA